MDFDSRYETQMKTSLFASLLALCISVTVTSDSRAAALAPQCTTALCHTLSTQAHQYTHMFIHPFVSIHL